MSLLRSLRGGRRDDPDDTLRADMPDITESVTDAGYYGEVSFRYHSAQVIAMMLLAVFVAVSLLTNADLLSADKLIYFVKDLATSVSLRESEARDTLVFASDESNQYTLYRDGLAVLGEQKLTIFTATGREAHSHLLAYRTPRLASSGRYLAAYDMGGKNLSLYNSFTCVKDIVTEHAIRFVDVCDKGYYCVVTDGAEYPSEVLLYDEGHHLMNRYRLQEYTLMAELSENGEELMLVSVSSDHGRMVTHLSFAVPGDNSWGDSFTVDDAYPVTCCYTTDGNILLLTTDALYLYSRQGVQLACHWLTRTVLSFRVDQEGCVLITRANAYDTSSGVMVFDKNADMVYNVSVEEHIADACYVKGSLVVLGERNLTVYQMDSTTPVSSITLQGDYNILLAYDNEEYVLCGKAKAIVIKPD